MSILIGAGPFCAGQSPPVALHDLAHSAPLFDFCSDGLGVIQYLNPINNQKQLFTVPMQPWVYEFPEVLVPAVWPPIVPPIVPVVPPVVPPIDDCDHHHGPPPVVTPEPGTYGLMFAGGVFVVVMGRRRVRTGQ